ncbi:variant erythrocyte surface antigen-1 family protein [Babesia caballi]|uniref:Variant erythrocyte surface antigen-1 family protein n=1 Tax=Babesia caballi TaxID=5871 RepID=A0AAV4LXV0_BABCB|nr:variant erythrocyte surface antigen-1 family protein [Babesia caballi]
MGGRELTVPPTNLKEAIDWILTIYNRGLTRNLCDAVEKLNGFNAQNTDISESNFQDVCGKVAVGVGAFLGYNGTFLTTAGIIKTKQAGGTYTSKYEGANWPDSDLEQRRQCALIFLGCAVAVYYCIGYLYWRLNGGGWVRQTVGGVGIYLNNFLKALGYNDGELSYIGGDDVRNKLAEKFEELSKDPNSPNDYPAFLKKLEEIEQKKAIDHPLASCFLLAQEYFTSKKGTEVTDAINKLKTKFKEFSQNSEITQSSALTPNHYEKVNDIVKDLLSQAAKFKPNEASTAAPEGHGGQPTNQSSTTGSIAGALTSIAAAGGAGAAYAFNVGGVQAILGAIFNFK